MVSIRDLTVVKKNVEREELAKKITPAAAAEVHLELLGSEDEGIQFKALRLYHEVQGSLNPKTQLQDNSKHFTLNFDKVESILDLEKQVRDIVSRNDDEGESRRVVEIPGVAQD